MKTFLILGYGIPKKIQKDDNYKNYIFQVFNKIYDLALGEKARIIFAGGKTDCFPPYKRTEAKEMFGLFKSLTRKVASFARAWEYTLEQKSISGIENLIYTKDILKKSKIRYVFCEWTRRKRIKIWSKKILGKNTQVIPIDFDVSSNRYLNKDFLNKKELKETKLGLKAVENNALLKECINWHKRKLEFFRKNGHIKNSDVVRKWWEEELKKKFNKFIIHKF